MSITETSPADDIVGGVATVEVAGERVAIQRPSTLKGTRALVLFQEIADAVPTLLDEAAEVAKTKRANQSVELTVAEAKLEFAPKPLRIDGVLQLDADGKPIMAASPLDSMTADDWERSGGVLRIDPGPPTNWEIGMSLFSTAYKASQEQVMQLLALFLISNRDLKAARINGDIDQLIEARGLELADDSFLDEIPELAVAIAEVMESNLRRKVAGLGVRVGEALRTYGVETGWVPQSMKTPNGSDGSPEETATATTNHGSSTSSPESMDGPPKPSSTPPLTSSSTSEDSSTPSEPPSVTPPTETDTSPPE